MTTLKDILNLMDYTICDFSEDAFIQVIDNQTQAHVRTDGKNFYIGGEYACDNLETVLRQPVACIEYIDDHCVISLA